MILQPNNYNQQDTGVGASVIEKSPQSKQDPMGTFYRVDSWVKNNEMRIAAQRSAQQKQAEDLLKDLKLNTNGILPADAEYFTKAVNEITNEHAKYTKANGIGSARQALTPIYQKYQTLADASAESNKHVAAQLKELADATKGENNLDVPKSVEQIKAYAQMPLEERAKLGRPNLLAFKTKTTDDYWREGSKNLKPAEYIAEKDGMYEKGKKIGIDDISRTIAGTASSHPEYEELMRNNYLSVARNPQLTSVADKYAQMAMDKKYNPLGLDVHYMPEILKRSVLAYVQPTDYEETPKAKAQREINTAATKEKQKLSIKDKHDLGKVDMPNLMKQMTGRSDYWVLDENNRPTRIPTELEVGRNANGNPIYATSIKVNDNDGIFSYTYTTAEKIPGTQPTENSDGSFTYSSADPIKMNQDLLDMLELNSNQKIKVVQEFNAKKSEYGGLNELVKSLKFEDQGVKSKSTPNVLGKDGETSTGDIIIQGKTRKIVKPNGQ